MCLLTKRTKKRRKPTARHTVCANWPKNVRGRHTMRRSLKPAINRDGIFISTVNVCGGWSLKWTVKSAKRKRFSLCAITVLHFEQSLRLKVCYVCAKLILSGIRLFAGNILKKLKRSKWRMKKLFALSLALVMTLSLAACGSRRAKRS